MKAIISTTFDDLYLFFLPITTYSWNRLGVDVICFMPLSKNNKELYKLGLISKVMQEWHLRLGTHVFKCPENKEATYAQCSRLYAGALDFIPDDEYLVTSDVDMAVFEKPQTYDYYFHIFGADLVPPHQYPMCYITSQKSSWKHAFNTYGKTAQQCLDELLGDIDCDNMRGNYWAKDQETAYNNINLKFGLVTTNRAKEGTQFATRRLDRDDAYILERDTTDVIDYHMNRPGYEHIETIVAIFQKKYPNDDFQWMIDYATEYKKLL